MPDTLRQQLRAATRAEHLALESQPMLRRLVSPELTLAEYGHTHRAMCAFYLGLEPVLESRWARLRHKRSTQGYQFERRSPWLIRDLEDLGQSVPAAASAGWERPMRDGYTLGVLYVLEGAALGARVIARSLSASVGVDADWGARHYVESARGNRWPSFCRWLEVGTSPDEWPQALSGARDTFSGLKTHLDHYQESM